jgi:hypothetical protein
MRLQDRSVGHHQAAKLRLKAKPLRLKAKPRSLSATSSGSQRSMISSANSADAFPGPAASAALFRFRKRWVAKKGRTSPGVARCGPSTRNAASYSQNETGATGGAHLGSRADRSDANIATSGGTSSSDLHLMISSAKFRGYVARGAVRHVDLKYLYGAGIFAPHQQDQDSLSSTK